MKKVLIVGISLLSIASVVKAQDKQGASSSSSESIFKPFKVDVSLGYAIPSGEGSKGGVLFAIEPKYAVMDKLAVGLRIEGAITARGVVSPDGESAHGDVKTSSSYLATGDYYFTNNTFRPFVGAGVGIFSLAAASGDFDGSGEAITIAKSSSKFGGMLRAGFEAGHFRLGVEYNLVGATKIPITDDAGTSYGDLKLKNGYLGIKVGAFFGGGRRK
ncbi:MAG: hypothetical protein JST68_08400 [Bacteroidetes bacterium]|nr:hypothetical protein [Bacteroidota bacterium]